MIDRSTIKRDYIGSADAYDIYKGNFGSLIKSKLNDFGFTNKYMERGIQLEKDILEQYCESLGIPWTHQVRFVGDGKNIPTYCAASVDGVAVVSPKKKPRNLEAKTSEKDAPETELDLYHEYPRYYLQCQWEMWLAGTKDQVIVWCKCPPIDGEESPYDENGDLEIYEIRVTYDKEVIDVFKKNAPLFWEQWEAALSNSAKLDEMVNLHELYQAELAIEQITMELAERKAVYDDIVKEYREQLVAVMGENGIVAYENDNIRISYVAPYEKPTVDTAKMKRDKIYDAYTKPSQVKASVRITIKKDKEEGNGVDVGTEVPKRDVSPRA